MTAIYCPDCGRESLFPDFGPDAASFDREDQPIGVDFDTIGGITGGAPV